jgi:tRNA threonylcarbamoyladenosine biosynthesis protein TsaE
MHVPILETRTLHWPDEAACERCAAALAASPALRDALLTLEGPLGAGKTTFTRHLLRALGVTGRIKSPSYAIVEPYELPGLSVRHFDLYRFGDPREWEDAGFRELVDAPGLTLVEWPDKAAGQLPPADLAVVLGAPEGERRRVELHAGTERGLALLAALPAGPAAGDAGASAAAAPAPEAAR